MKNLALASVLLLAGTAAAFAQTAPRTEEFVQKVAISDMFEIQSSQLAASKTTGPAREFAQMMIQDHQKTSMELKQLLAQGKVKATPPTALDEKHMQKLRALETMSSDRIAAQYQKDQVEAHTEAVNLFQAYAAGGEDPELKQWAARTLPALQHHLEAARKLAQ
jgi:putative membrane protein